MPFKSEKQRRYLWANEPEIARDWTDTYGSKIKKAEGGITRVGLWNGGNPNEDRAREEAANQQRSQTFDAKSNKGTTYTGASHHHSVDTPAQKKAQIEADKINVRNRIRDEVRKQEKEKREERVEVFRAKNYNSPMNKFSRLSLVNQILGPLNHRDFFLDKVLTAGHYGDTITEEDFYNMSPTEQEKVLKEYNRARGMGEIDAYGRTVVKEGDGPRPLWMQQGYPSYEAWLAAQNQGGGGVTATPATTQTTSPFQQSLNTGIAQGISPYYVGADPTAANLAWGKQFNVDPRTMYRTTWADGGPIRQRYFLGKIVKKIGRDAKKVIKSPIAKAALLGFGMFGIPGGSGWTGGLLKSNLMSSGIGEAIKNKLFMKKLEDETYSGFDPWKLGIMGASTLPFFMDQGDEKEEDKPFDYEAAKNAYLNELMNIKRGAMAGTLDPNKFNYLAVAKDGGRIGYQSGGMEDPMLVDEYRKYVFEMEEMGLQPMSFEEFKRHAIAGMATGGRAGFYSGGQSIPSEHSLEDARKTAMQDRLGGITEVMKQADLYRQGDVGQMYMANGGLMASAVTGGEERDIATQMWDRLDKQTQSDYGSFENYFKSGDWIEGVKQIDQGWAGAEGGRIKAQEGGIMDLGGVEKDYRETGGFVPIGKEEKADDVPARLSLNEFVMTADAVRGMGDGDIDKGAERMEDLMETLEVKGKRNQGAQNMFEVSERLSAVV